MVLRILIYGLILFLIAMGVMYVLSLLL